MADTQAATRCPTCQKAFKIKPEYMGRSLQCKSCKTVFKASLADIPAVEPVENKIKVHNALPSESYVQRLARQQRSSSNSMLVLVLLGLFGAGLGFYFYKESIFQLLHVASNQSARPTLPTVQESLLQPNVMIDKLGGDLTSMPEQNQRDKRNLARIPAPYPGRALLIGIRDYLYLNPLNPGFRVERSFLGDALGLQSLQRNLITELSFPREQVLLLTDVDDQKPVVPTRATIQATVEDFLQNSRTGDRIVLVFAVHAVHLAGNTYLIPIDGEIPPENAKPDVERDARLAEQLIPLSWLYEKLQQCPSKQKLLILDIAQSDPEAGVARLSPGPLTEAMFAEIEKVPEDVQIWLPCRASQSSIGLSNSGQAGTVFMDVLNQHLTFSVERNWKRIEKDPRLKAGILPLVLLAEDIEKEVAAYVSQKGYEQQPILLGKELTPVPSENETAQAVALKVVQPSEALVSGKEIQSVLLELGLASDAMRRLGTSSFPPLLKSHFEAYTADYASLAELENKINEFPLRLLTQRAVKLLERSMKTFRMRFPEESDEANFKRKIEQEQETPAYVTAELSDILDEMKQMEERRSEEPSRRWQAHFDYTQARILAHLAHVQEYSFVLGNKLRKDTPIIKDRKNHNGWIIVPQRKLEQRETRGYDSERQKLLSKIIQEHPGTPWEILARREQVTILGLRLQETYLEEGKPLP